MVDFARNVSSHNNKKLVQVSHEEFARQRELFIEDCTLYILIHLLIIVIYSPTFENTIDRLSSWIMIH